MEVEMPSDGTVETTFSDLATFLKDLTKLLESHVSAAGSSETKNCLKEDGQNKMENGAEVRNGVTDGKFEGQGVRLALRPGGCGWYTSSLLIDF
jgi:hypothetical protein